MSAPGGEANRRAAVVKRFDFEVGFASDPMRPIWEAQTIPGRLVGLGETPMEAIACALELIYWTAEEEKDFEAWYAEAAALEEQR